LVEYSKTLEGLARHASVHAAGILIAPDDITNYVPLAVTPDKHITTQWTMGWCEAIGLLKMDFLGLRNLTVIHNTEEMIRKRYNKNFSIDQIPLDDASTYELFGKGNTTGIFQFESSGMQDYLRKLKPNRLEDLIAMNALYRPGPMDMIDDFIARKKGEKEITYLHPKLEPILRETYGIIVYQEQVMRITSELGGFSLAEADIMRRIMGKKKKSEMQVQKAKFIKGCIENGVEETVAQAIAEMIEKFASYGFNKSHAAAYALIAYQTGYLKGNYGAEFMAANLSSEVNNTDRIVAMIDECRKMGIEVVPPDVNYSQAKFEPLDEKKIAFGLVAIKNVGAGAINSIIEGRKEGEYKNVFQMLQSVDLRLVNKKVLESLVQSGAFDSLEGTRAQNFHALEMAIEFGQNFQSKKRRNHGQRSLFDLNPEVNDMVSYPTLPDVPDWTSQEKLLKEREYLGFYITGHPLQKYATVVNLYKTPLDSVNGQDNGEGINSVNVCGMITEIRTLLDRKENQMAFIKVEDFNRVYEAVVFGSIYPKLENKLQKDALILLHGRLNSSIDEPIVKIICDDAYTLEEVPAVLTESLMLKVDKSKMTSENITYLKNILYTHRGKVPVYFKVSLNGKDEINMVSKKVKISPTLSLINELDRILTLNNIRVKVKKL